MPRLGNVVEWARKALSRRVMRLCEVCLKSNRRCQDSSKRGYKPHDTWKNYRVKQWRGKCSNLDEGQ